MIEPSFTWLAWITAVSAPCGKQHAETSIEIRPDFMGTHADIASIAVEIDQGGERCVGWRAVPGEEKKTVICFERHFRHFRHTALLRARALRIREVQNSTLAGIDTTQYDAIGSHRRRDDAPKPIAHYLFLERQKNTRRSGPGVFVAMLPPAIRGRRRRGPAA